MFCFWSQVNNIMKKELWKYFCGKICFNLQNSYTVQDLTLGDHNVMSILKKHQNNSLNNS